MSHPQYRSSIGGASSSNDPCSIASVPFLMDIDGLTRDDMQWEMHHCLVEDFLWSYDFISSCLHIPLHEVRLEVMRSYGHT